MVEIIQLANLAMLFIIVIIIIVLIGILITEYFKRKGNKRKGILSFIAILSLLVALIIIDTSQYVYGFVSLVLKNAMIILNSIVVVLLGVISYRYWKEINKKLFFSMLILAAGITTVLVALSISFSLFLRILNIIFVSLVTILFYFFIIDFLIKTSNGRIKREKKIRKKHFWKKIILVCVGLSIAVVLLFAGVIIGTFWSESQQLSSELNIYNWEDYFGENTLEDFEKEFGVKVNLVTFEDEYEILHGETNLSEYDLIIISDDLTKDMIELDLLAKIKKGNIPNLKYIDEKCVREDSEKYVVPYFFGTTGLAFNTKYLPEDTNSWDVLWNAKYSGKIGILNNPSEAIGMAAKYVGLPLIPQTEFQLKKVEQFLLSQRLLFDNYKSETTILNELISEELWAAHIYDSVAKLAMEENENIKYVIPKEGGAQWVDNFVIVKDAKNKYTAETFINYILDYEVNKDITEYQIAYSCNEEVMGSIDLESLEEIPESSLKFLEYFSDYDETEEVKVLKEELWRGLIRE
jgi:spermidine/putrescine transport system substrate-binding protein